MIVGYDDGYYQKESNAYRPPSQEYWTYFAHGVLDSDGGNDLILTCSQSNVDHVCVCV